MKGVSPEKFQSCVEDVKAKGGAKDPKAVCAVALRRSEIDWSQSDIQKNIGEFNAMFKATHPPRASAQAYPELRGVHTATPGTHEPGRSQAGIFTRLGAKPQAREEHKQVIREQRKIRPKLPR